MFENGNPNSWRMNFTEIQIKSLSNLSENCKSTCGTHLDGLIHDAWDLGGCNTVLVASISKILTNLVEIYESVWKNKEFRMRINK